MSHHHPQPPPSPDRDPAISLRSPAKRLKTRLKSLLSRPENAHWVAFVRAYLIGCGTEVVPLAVRLVIVRFIVFTRRRSGRALLESLLAVVVGLLRLVIKGFRPAGLGMACGIAVGGARVGEAVVRRPIEALVRACGLLTHRWRHTTQRVDADTAAASASARPLSPREQRAADVLATFCAAFASSLLAITVLQSPQSSTTTQSPLNPTTTPYPTLDGSPGGPTHTRRGPRPGRQSATLDFTLFFTVRALDTLGRALFDNYSPACLAFLRGSADTLMFQLCCWRIMSCWFYTPSRLPLSYVKWINMLAEMDQRLLELIRLGKAGEYVYGARPATAGVRSLGHEIATNMGMPPEAGDPELITQLSCRIVHGKLGNSEHCTVNVLRRWVKAWRQSIGIYLPVFTVPALLFNRERLWKAPLQTVTHILLGSARSAAFLASFVGLTWAGVCIGRSGWMRVVLEKVSGRRVRPIDLDSRLAPQLGGFLAGLSILLEHKRRRGEMALYVATRALCATVEEILPDWLRGSIARNRWVSIWVERLTFAGSIGTIMCAPVYRTLLLFSFCFAHPVVWKAKIVHHPDYVRGIVKGVLKFAIGPDWTRKPVKVVTDSDDSKDGHTEK